MTTEMEEALKPHYAYVKARVEMRMGPPTTTELATVWKIEASYFDEELKKSGTTTCEISQPADPNKEIGFHRIHSSVLKLEEQNMIAKLARQRMKALGL